MFADDVMMLACRRHARVCGIVGGTTLLLTSFVGSNVRKRSSDPSLSQGSTEFTLLYIFFHVFVQVSGLDKRLSCAHYTVDQPTSRATYHGHGGWWWFGGGVGFFLVVSCWLSWIVLVAATQIDASNALVVGAMTCGVFVCNTAEAPCTRTQRFNVPAYFSVEGL